MRTVQAVPGPRWHTWSAPLHGSVAYIGLLRRSALAALDHDALTVAQAVAYSAMMALFPALIVTAAVIGMLPSSLPFRSQLAVFFVRILPSNVIPVLQGYFSVTHRSQTAGALLGSLVVSLLGAGNVMATLMEGFRRAHDLPLVRGHFLRRRGRALGLVLLAFLPMAIASALVVFGHFITHWLTAELPGPFRTSVAVVANLLRWSVALAGSTGILAMMYYLGTDLDTHMRAHLEPWVREPWNILRRKWTWRASLPGAVLATLLWFLATLAFGFYVTRFANYSRVYGSLGAAIALMIWLYIIALCVLIGAEFNAQRVQAHRKARHVASFGDSRQPHADAKV